MAPVTLTRIEKVYADGTCAVSSLDLQIEDGEFVVLVGPSGCGKTTVLRMIAGLEDVSGGTIEIGGRPVNELEPRKRDVAMVFQNYALYPNMSVAGNIGFGLKMRRMPKDEAKKRVAEIARILGISDLLDRKPGQLSGGQRQRVAMGRAIVRDPSVFLMDEPLSNLDAKLRVQMRSEIARIQRDLHATTIYVTHDQVEAMTMGTRVAVMRKGKLQQIGPPRDIYEQPTNLFVATFIGSPSMNLVQGALEKVDGWLSCRIGDQHVPLPPERVAAYEGLQGYVGRTVAVGIRPEHLREAETVNGSGLYAKLKCVAITTEVLGSELIVHAEIEAEPVMTAEVLEVIGDVDVTAVTDLTAGKERRRVQLLGRFDASSDVEPGDPLELAVDPGKLRFFDLETESAIGAAA